LIKRINKNVKNININNLPDIWRANKYLIINRKNCSTDMRVLYLCVCVCGWGVTGEDVKGR
jgi:hypothetical protein